MLAKRLCRQRAKAPTRRYGVMPRGLVIGRRRRMPLRAPLAPGASRSAPATGGSRSGEALETIREQHAADVCLVDAPRWAYRQCRRNRPAYP